VLPYQLMNMKTHIK